MFLEAAVWLGGSPSHSVVYVDPAVARVTGKQEVDTIWTVLATPYRRSAAGRVFSLRSPASYEVRELGIGARL